MARPETEPPPTPGGSEDEGLRRVLGPVSATCIVIGAIVGVGIFFAPSGVAERAGSPGVALAAWGLGGLVAILGALCFAELGGMYRQSGGQYQILRDSYGPFMGFLFVFCNATAVQAGAMAVIAIICSQNLGLAFDGAEPSNFMVLVLSTVLIVGLMAANIVGVKQGARIQNITVFAKVATLLLVVALAIASGGEAVVSEGAETGTEEVVAEAAEEEDEESSEGFFGAIKEKFGLIALLFAALVPAMFAFGGWQHCLWISGEVRRPERNVPLAVVVGVSIVVTCYLLVNWAYFELLGYDGVASTKALAAEAVGVVWPEWGERIVAGAVAFSAFGVLNAQLLGGPRLIYAMARDGKFFQIFGRAHPRFATPYYCIALLAALALVLLYVAGRDGKDGVGQLLTFVVFVDGTFFLMTGLALFQLRRLRPDAPRSVRVPLYPWLPMTFLLLQAGVIFGAWFGDATQHAAISGLSWIGGATLLYFLFFRAAKQTKVDADEPETP